MFFVLKRDFTYALGVGVQGVFLGGTGPKTHSSGTGLVAIFYSIILARGAQAVIWGGARTQNAPCGAGPEA